MDSVRLAQAIDIYEAAILAAVRELGKVVILDIAYVSWIIVMVVLSILYANLAGLAIALGLGGATIATQSRKWVETMKAYFLKSGQLKQTVQRLRIEYEICSSTDEPCLDKIRDLLHRYLDALEEAAEQPS